MTKLKSTQSLRPPQGQQHPVQPSKNKKNKGPWVEVGSWDKHVYSIFSLCFLKLTPHCPPIKRKQPLCPWLIALRTSHLSRLYPLEEGGNLLIHGFQLCLHGNLQKRILLCRGEEHASGATCWPKVPMCYIWVKRVWATNILNWNNFGKVFPLNQHVCNKVRCGCHRFPHKNHLAV